MEKEKKVTVTVTGTHTHEGLPPHETKSVSSGVMRTEDGKYIIEYEEYLSEERPEDFKGGIATYNLVTISPDEMTIVRKGSVTSDLSFKSGHEHESDYRTPFGYMKSRVNTKHYNMYTLEKGNRIIAEAEYTISMNGMSLSEVVMHVDITPAQ